MAGYLVINYYNRTLIAVLMPILFDKKMSNIAYAEKLANCQLRPVAVLGKNIWGAWPLIVWEATTAKRNLL